MFPPGEHVGLRVGEEENAAHAARKRPGLCLLRAERCPFNCVPSPRASLSNAHVSKYLLFPSRSGFQGLGRRDPPLALKPHRARPAGSGIAPPALPGSAAAARGTQPKGKKAEMGFLKSQ
ncbi:unnamed protein product [Natator depressus]